MIGLSGMGKQPLKVQHLRSLYQSCQIYYTFYIVPGYTGPPVPNIHFYPHPDFRFQFGGQLGSNPFREYQQVQVHLTGEIVNIINFTKVHRKGNCNILPSMGGKIEGHPHRGNGNMLNSPLSEPFGHHCTLMGFKMRTKFHSALGGLLRHCPYVVFRPVLIYHQGRTLYLISPIHTNSYHGKAFRSTLPPDKIIPTRAPFASTVPFRSAAKGTAAEGSTTIFILSQMSFIA